MTEQLECTGFPVLQNHAKAEAKIWSLRKIFITDHPNTGWMPKYETMLDDLGVLKRFDPPEVPKFVKNNVCLTPEILEGILEGNLEDPYFKQPAYNLELEDSDAYFVGELGIWVA